MTNKIYRTIKGKTVDMGALRLQNEHVRAVGNMGVNARGDRIDAQGNVIDSVNQQHQRRIQKMSNVTDTPVHSSQRAVQAQNQAALVADAIPAPMPLATEEDLDNPEGPMDEVVAQPTQEVQPEPVVIEEPAPVVSAPIPVEIPTTTQPATALDASSGLAAAIARAKTVKQELEKNPNQPTSIRKI